MPVGKWLEIDRYALALTQRLQDEMRADYARYEFHLIAQRLQTFCSEDLGGFYLDILKDRLYTAGADSAARRSAQNALYHITHSLVRLMAPILSFTAEEAWEVLSGKDDCKRVSRASGMNCPMPQLDGDAITAWLKIDGLARQGEQATGGSAWRGTDRFGAGRRGGCVCRGEDYDVLARLGDDLRLCSSPRVPRCIASRRKPKQHIDVSASLHDKCERCWHYRADVGADAQHPTLCGRCVSNLYGSGEARKYA